MNLRFTLISVLMLLQVTASAQLGGEGTYRFLDLTNSARMAALGGSQVALADNDLDLTFHNPALLTPEMNQQLAINYVNYLSDINFGYAAFAKNVDGLGTFAAGIHFIDYGKFIEAGEEGEITGSFTAGEYALNLYFARPINDKVTAGVNLKPVYSVLESYKSFGIAADIGITYKTNDNATTFALVARNIGTQISTYYENGEREKLPFDLQLGFSKKLAHAPFRIMATIHHLNKWDLTQETQFEETTNFSANKTESGISKMMRHLIIGAEMLPGPNFTLRVGYNHQRRKELSIENRSGMVGFSGGFGLKISKLTLNYGLASYHLSGASHHFSIATNLSQFIK